MIGSTVESIIVRCALQVENKRKWDKRFPCLFCEKMYPKLPRHYQSRHRNESQVRRLKCLEKNPGHSEEIKKQNALMRRELIEELRKKGTHWHNMKVLKKKEGELIVEKRPSLASSKSFSEFLPCEHCLGWYYRTDLHRHMKTCHKKVGTSSNSRSNRVQGTASMMLPCDDAISSELQKVFAKMKVDEVSTLCKSDQLIIIYGNKLCNKHINNDDQSKYIANKLRELSRLTLKMRDMCPQVKCLDDVVNPVLFSKIIQAVTDLCGWDSDKKKIATPSLGIKLGQLLNKIAAIVASRAIQSSSATNNEDRKRAKDFQYLVEKEWDDEIAKQSRTELETRKWNKPQLIPLTEDLIKLKKHILEVQEQSISDLKKNKGNTVAFRSLTTSTLASIIIFNRRRQGEPSKLKTDYDKNKEFTFNKETEESLTTFEKKLCATLKRIEIRGKRGRKVPLILTQINEKAIKQLIQCRDAVGVHKENPFVFAVLSGSVNYIRGSDALRKHVMLSKLTLPEVVTSTRLRKHIATLSQLLNLEERELEMLANYLGHDITVHREFYRLPEHTTQLAKCGKLLTMLDQGKCKEYIGKRLDDISLNLEG